MPRRLLVLLLALAGCETDTVEVSLADLQARMYLRPSSGPLTASRNLLLAADIDANGDCPVLPGGTTFELDGVESTDVTLGGAESPHGEVHCIGMFAIWPLPTSEPAVSTFEVDDGDTTWTFIVERPFSQRSFRRTAPLGQTAHGGDALSFAVDPPTGTLSNASVSASVGTSSVFRVDAAQGLTISGPEVHLTVPAVTSTIAATLEVHADLELAVQRCDAPLGCEVTAGISSRESITLAP